MRYQEISLSFLKPGEEPPCPDGHVLLGYSFRLPDGHYEQLIGSSRIAGFINNATGSQAAHWVPCTHVTNPHVVIVEACAVLYIERKAAQGICFACDGIGFTLERSDSLGCELRRCAHCGKYKDDSQIAEAAYKMVRLYRID